jgi:hypothetical protein
MSSTTAKPRAAAVAEKLDAARASLIAHNDEVAEVVLAAAENLPGAPKRLFDLRAKISTAEREVEELTKAHALAARLDRQTAVTAATQMRGEQFAECKKQFAAREKAMAAVLKAAADMAAAYGQYSEATLLATIAAPSGTVIPAMMIGDNGSYGPVFGPCERLILAELYRCAPERSDGIGRFVVPFAKAPNEMVRGKPEAIRPGIDEMRDAHAAIIADVDRQIDKLNTAAMAAAEMTPTANGKAAA